MIRAQALGFFEQAFALARQTQKQQQIEQALHDIDRLSKDGGNRKKGDAYYDRLFFGEVRLKMIPAILLAQTKAPANADPHLPDGIKDMLVAPCSASWRSRRKAESTKGT